MSGVYRQFRCGRPVLIKKPQAWAFTGKVVDFSGADQSCAFCNDRHLRFGYQVETGQPPRFAYLGYDCLVKNPFRLGPFVDGHLQESKSSLQTAATRRAATRELIRLNKRLKQVSDVSLERLINSYQKFGRFSPRQAVFLLSVCQQNEVAFPRALINVSTKENQHRAQLAELSPKEAQSILDLLSDSQKRWLTKVDVR